MKKFMLTAAAGIALALIATPVQARPSRFITIQMPSVTQAGTAVVVSGRAPSGAKVVRIERKIGKSWVLAKRAWVKSGSYRATVRPKVGVGTFRARIKTTYSRATTLRIVKPPAPSDSCGTRPAKGDGTYWSCTFVDDFSGASLDRTKWVPQTQFGTGVSSARACYADDPSVVNQAGGALQLTVRRVETPVSCTFGGMSGPTNYLAGGVMTYRLFSQQYGRFEARIKNTATKSAGLHEAFWLWPDDRVASDTVWPYAGEIDISETYSRYSNLSIPFLHYAADVYGTLLGVNTAWNCVAYRGVWNTYTLEWTASKLVIKVNGRTCLTNTSGDPAFAKPYIMALTQGLGAAGNEFTGTAPLPATMSVDYVKVWQ